MKKKYKLLIINLLVSVFIGVNLFFYIKTSNMRQEKRFHISLVMQASSIEKDSYHQLANMDDFSETEIGKGTLIFEKRHNELRKNAYLDTLDLRLKQLNSYKNNRSDNIQPRILKGLYVNLNGECRNVISKLLKLNRKIDDELTAYFNFGFSFIFIVSGLTLLLVFVSFIKSLRRQ